MFSSDVVSIVCMYLAPWELDVFFREIKLDFCVRFKYNGVCWPLDEKEIEVFVKFPNIIVTGLWFVFWECGNFSCIPVENLLHLKIEKRGSGVKIIDTGLVRRLGSIEKSGYMLCDDLEFVRGCHRLVSFEVVKCYMCTRMDWLKECVGLKRVVVRWCNSWLNLSVLCGLHVRDVHLMGIKVVSDNISCLSKCNELRRLCFVNCFFDKLSMERLRCVRLREFRCVHGKNKWLQKLGERVMLLEELKGLRKLSLIGQGWVDLRGLGGLGELGKLKRIDMRGSSCDVDVLCARGLRRMRCDLLMNKDVAILEGRGIVVEKN